ncbi:MAG: hypothetical protein LC808_31725 [Actinobacteria bacterium]|nr:hypothetical protein [Actinomycetota bacterium]
MAVRAAAVGFALAAMVLASCADAVDESPPEPRHPIALMALPKRHQAECRRFPRLEPVCPTTIPIVEASQKRARAFESGRDHFVFFSEWSGPYPGVTAKNAPPRFVHVVAHAGGLDKAFPFQWPTETTPLPDPIPRKRPAPMLLDDVTWYGINGELLLAPSFPAGGIDGDHVVFRWAEGSEEYAISIHGWSPLEATIATLRSVVGSTAAARASLKSP